MNIPEPSFDPDDFRLTAYALDELPDPAERAAVEQILRQSAQARDAVQEIRELTAALRAEYAGQLAAEPGNDPAPGNVIPMVPRLWPRRLLLAAALLLLTASVARLTITPPPAAPGRNAIRADGAKVARDIPVSPAPMLPDLRVAIQPPPLPPTADHIKQLRAPAVSAPAAGPVSAASLDRFAVNGGIGITRDQSRLNLYAKTEPVADKPAIAPRVYRNSTSFARNESGLASDEFRSRLTAPGEARPADLEAPAPVAALKDTRRAADADTAVYEHRAANPFLAAKDNPLSTFSVDVDTASYANVRRFIESGRLPPPDAVRVEELINYFPYNDAPPAPGDPHPFAVHLEAAACPWNPQDRLVRIGIKGREIARDKRPPSNLVFLLDVSGSMEPPERLPLIKASMRLLVEQLREDDRVAIVTYAGESGIALPSTTGDHPDRILRALDALHAGGSTNGASGIELAYRVAREGFIPGGTNRVILATDGDFNVGVTNPQDLVRMIEGEARTGVALSALGVGTDNYKDATMQKLADKGNGNYAYIDRLDEARKVLVEQMSGTLVTIAKDVKIQVEFNPAAVAAYRLIGYEKRLLRKEDFNDDRVDAGEIGAGHGVTALYEVVPVGQPVPQTPPAVDALRYGEHPASAAVAPAPDTVPGGPSHELLTVKIRHKAPDGDRSERSYEESLIDHGAAGDFAGASADFKFAAAVATFGLALRDETGQGGPDLGAALELAQASTGADPGGYRAGFIELVRRARAIRSPDAR